MRKSLFLRTDVLPEEIPLLFSNKNLYIPFTRKFMENNLEIMRKINLITSVPYYFDIPKDKTANRKIALLHPIAQLQAYFYIMKYEQMIIEFCSASMFSVRSPSKLNSIKFDRVKGLDKKTEKLNEEFSFSKNITVTTEEDQRLFFNYFSYRPFKNIRDLQDSAKFNRSKYKYDHYIKLDIQNFFPSIYTHSLAWAIFGEKSLAKKNKDENLFANATDEVCKRINFNETNGLIVGPEFARVIAEVMMTRVDSRLYRKLNELNLVLNKDYIIYRYIDDIFVFTKTVEDSIKIENEISKILDDYNLTLNTSKREIQSRPFKIYNKSIISLNRNLSEFNANNMYSYLRYKDNLKKFLEEQSEDKELIIPATKHNWSNLFRQIEKLIYENEDDSRKIVNYFLKAIREQVTYSGGTPWKCIETIEIMSSVFSLDINYKSTYTLIANYLKILLQLNELKSEELDNDEVEKKSSNLNRIEESIFQNAYFLLKNNFNKIETMHELIIFMKQLPKSINSQFLCRIISNNSDNYFVLCSVAYYILNEDLTEVDNRFITVKNLLEKTIDSYSQNYSSKGSGHITLEGEYFYIINDFSYYPGFNSFTREKLKQCINIGYEQHLKRSSKLTREERRTLKKSLEEKYKIKHRNISPKKLDEICTDEISKTNEELQDKMKDVWENITKRSYFQWNKTNEAFSKSIVKKIINVSIKPSDY